MRAPGETRLPCPTSRPPDRRNRSSRTGVSPWTISVSPRSRRPPTTISTSSAASSTRSRPPRPRRPDRRAPGGAGAAGLARRIACLAWARGEEIASLDEIQNALDDADAPFPEEGLAFATRGALLVHRLQALRDADARDAAGDDADRHRGRGWAGAVHRILDSLGVPRTESPSRPFPIVERVRLAGAELASLRDDVANTRRALDEVRAPEPAAPLKAVDGPAARVRLLAARERRGLETIADVLDDDLGDLGTAVRENVEGAALRIRGTVKDAVDLRDRVLEDLDDVEAALDEVQAPDVPAADRRGKADAERICLLNRDFADVVRTLDEILRTLDEVGAPIVAPGATRPLARGQTIKHRIRALSGLARARADELDLVEQALQFAQSPVALPGERRGRDFAERIRRMTGLGVDGPVDRVLDRISEALDAGRAPPARIAGPILDVVLDRIRLVAADRVQALRDLDVIGLALNRLGAEIVARPERQAVGEFQAARLEALFALRHPVGVLTSVEDAMDEAQFPQGLPDSRASRESVLLRIREEAASRARIRDEVRAQTLDLLDSTLDELDVPRGGLVRGVPGNVDILIRRLAAQRDGENRAAQAARRPGPSIRTLGEIARRAVAKIVDSPASFLRDPYLARILIALRNYDDGPAGSLQAAVDSSPPRALALGIVDNLRALSPESGEIPRPEDVDGTLQALDSLSAFLAGRPGPSASVIPDAVRRVRPLVVEARSLLSQSARSAQAPARLLLRGSADILEQALASSSDL